MAAISLTNVSKVYANGQVAVRDLTLDITDGELMVLVGPSGSGKSTVVRLIAGLEAASAGRIIIGGRDVTAVAPQHRDLAMVFQNYALYPHKSVRDNLAFGLRVRREPAARIDARVREVAQTLGIEELLDRKPAQLSGGQRQRVALGRAIVREPQAFLLDEPLSNLDPLLRVATRAELALLHRRLGTTMVYVTHDQEEAMTLGSRIAVMRDGAIEQVAAPLTAFERPATSFVARFVGAPAMNLWPAGWSRNGERLALTTSFFTLEVDSAGRRTPEGANVLLGIRPHDIVPGAVGTGDADAQIEVVEPLGASTTIHASLEDGAAELVRIVVPPHESLRAGDRVGLKIRRDRLHLFDAGSGRAL